LGEGLPAPTGAANRRAEPARWTNRPIGRARLAVNLRPMRRTRSSSGRALFAIGAALACVLSARAEAQLKGLYVAGFSGLQDGTQPPPGISVYLPIYFYTTDDIRDGSGHSIGPHPRVNVTFIGPTVGWVTNVKVWNANLGGSIAPVAWIKSRLEGDVLDVPGQFKFTDTYVQPVQLGWKAHRAEFVAGYGLFVPTGKWSLGGRDNSGLGMWSNILQGGTTLHLDQHNEWTFSTLATYEVNSHKKNSDLRTGNTLTFEGGLGRTWFSKMKMVGGNPEPSLVTNFGAVYYAQFKVTGDDGALISALAAGARDRVYGAGLEASLALPEKSLAFDLRAEPEFGARSRTQGVTYMLTVGYQIKSLVKPPPPSVKASR
jgi:hypothetical protein